MKKFIITGAFPEPEWTQVPNKFFEMLPEMEASEALTTLVLIRETYGYHRPTCKMSIAKLAAAAGISEGSVKTGAEMAEARGTFRRTNPTGKTSAEWELVIGSTIDPSTIEGVVGQPLTLSGSTIDPQVGVKESIKKENKPDLFDFEIQRAKENQAIQDVLNAFEKTFGFGALNWDSRPEWRRFSKWVVTEYQRDNSVFSDYVQWRNGAGKYQAMSNNKIRQNPEMFMDTGYPTFLAHTSMYGDKPETPAPIYRPEAEPKKNYVPAPERLRHVETK